MCGLILAPAHLNYQMPEALTRMGHRGAEGFSGLDSIGGWGLGHVRLALQSDAVQGHQPFLNTKGSRMYAFVGEVFNPLWEQTEAECILAELAGPSLDGLHQFDGFWSIIEVSEFGAIRAITDHLGMKPLYFWEARNLISSEIDTMWAFASPPPLDETYLSNCIKFGYDYSGRTPYQGIRQVPPGTVLSYDPMNSSWSQEKYWNWDLVPVQGDLTHLVVRSISHRVEKSSKSVALLVSGGLDSSIIYYTLRDVLDYEIAAFALENGESEFLPPGVQLSNPDPVDLKTALRSMQAPLDLGSLVPQYQLAKLLGDKGYHVCLSGDGADEVFGGYSRAALYDSQASDVFCELPYYHLPRLDRMMMRRTIELRAPFLAPEVVAYGLRLPWAERTSKQALKEAFKEIVPDEILNRPKHPLKSAAVLRDPLKHRSNLVELFRAQHNYQIRL